MRGTICTLMRCSFSQIMSSLQPSLSSIGLIKSRISPHRSVGLERDCHSLLSSWIVDRFSGSVDRPSHKCACASFWRYNSPEIEKIAIALSRLFKSSRCYSNSAVKRRDIDISAVISSNKNANAPSGCGRPEIRNVAPEGKFQISV